MLFLEQPFCDFYVFCNGYIRAVHNAHSIFCKPFLDVSYITLVSAYSDISYELPHYDLLFSDCLHGFPYNGNKGHTSKMHRSILRPPDTLNMNVPDIACSLHP